MRWRFYCLSMGQTPIRPPQALGVAKEDPLVARGFQGGALHAAIRHGMPVLCQFLIEAGADIEKPDLDGWTPLGWCACYGNAKVAAHLLSLGAKQAVRARIWDMEGVDAGQRVWRDWEEMRTTKEGEDQGWQDQLSLERLALLPSSGDVNRGSSERSTAKNYL